MPLMFQGVVIIGLSLKQHYSSTISLQLVDENGEFSSAVSSLWNAPRQKNFTDTSFPFVNVQQIMCSKETVLYVIVITFGF